MNRRSPILRWFYLLRAVGIPLLAAHPLYAAVTSTDIERGRVVIHYDNQRDWVGSYPWDSTFTVDPQGNVKVHSSAFALEGLVGADLVGLDFSPWAGLRLAHVWNFGVDIGFDRYRVTWGLDFMWRDIIVGPNMNEAFDLSGITWGAKAAFQF